ncbi:PhzF family phenazine biosynthesis protein [Nocardia salmonicida]
MNAHDVPDAPDIQVEVVRVFTDPAGNLGNALGIARAGDVVALDKQELAARLGFSETTVVSDPVDGVADVRIYTPAVELPFAGHPTVGTAWWLDVQRTPVHTLRVPKFVFRQLDSVEELAALSPVDFTVGQHFFWAWTDESRGALRARMFAPAMGIAEDEATGAAAVALTGQLRRGLIITQGQGSQLYTEWDSDGWVRLGGRVAEDHVVVL